MRLSKMVRPDSHLLLAPVFLGLGIWWLLTQQSFHWFGWCCLGVVPLLAARAALEAYSRSVDDHDTG